MALPIFSVAALMLGQAAPAEAPDAGQAVVQELQALQGEQQAGNAKLDSIAEHTQASRAELQGLRQDQSAARAAQARAAAQLSRAIELLRGADVLLVAGEFSADALMAEAAATLGDVPGPEAASALARIDQGRYNLADRNFDYARDDMFWAVQYATTALGVR